MKNEKISIFMQEAMSLTPNFHFRKGCMAPLAHAELKLSHHQIFCLLAIWKAGTISMGELAAQLGVSNQQITRTMDSLVKENYVERFIDDANRRVVQARISEAGKRFFASFEETMQKNIAKTLEVLDEEEIDACIAHMKALNAILSKLKSNC